MSKLSKEIFEFLQRQGTVELLIAFQLYVLRVHQIVRRNYAKKYGAGQATPLKGSSGSRLEAGELRVQERRLRQLCKTVGGADASGVTGASGPKNDDGHWHWRDMVKLPSVCIYYEYLIASYLIYILIKKLQADKLERLVSWLNLPLAPHCYILGNVVAPEQLIDRMAIIFCSNLLIWRTVVVLRNKSHNFSLFIFLAIDDADLERFYALLGREREQAKTLIAAAAAAVASPLAAYAMPAEMLAERCRPLARALHRDYLEPDAEGEDTGPSVERLFKDLMCHRVERGLAGASFYKLRPNRTLAARRHLRRHLAKMVIVLAGFFLLAVLIVAPPVLYQIFNYHRYLRLRPNCSTSVIESKVAPPKDADLAHNSWQAPALQAHFLASALVDFFENVAVWVDTGISTLYLWASIYFLNYDVCFYWRVLNRKLERVHGRVLVRHYARAASNQQPGAESFGHPAGRLSWRDRERRELDEELNELLVEFYDFFRQIKELDVLVSDLLAYSIYVWVSFFVIFGNMLRNDTKLQSEPLVILFIASIVSITYFIITMGSFNLFKLHTNCLGSIKLVCSIMALDEGDQRERLASLLEFYSTTKRSAYTILRQRPYTKTTYLSIFGWSVTCFFVIDGFRRHD